MENIFNLKEGDFLKYDYTIGYGLCLITKIVSLEDNGIVCSGRFFAHSDLGVFSGEFFSMDKKPGLLKTIFKQAWRVSVRSFFCLKKGKKLIFR